MLCNTFDVTTIVWCKLQLCLIQILGELGRVAEVYINGGIVVAVKGRLWTLDPRSVLPAPGETPPDMDGPGNQFLDVKLYASRSLLCGVDTQMAIIILC